MPLSVLFWFLMILWAILGFWERWAPSPPPPVRFGGGLLTFILLGMLGLKVFGSVIT